MKYRRLNEEQTPNEFSFDPTSISEEDLQLLYNNAGYFDKIDFWAVEYLGFHKNRHVYAVLITDKEDVVSDENIYGTTWYVGLGKNGLEAEPSGNSFIEETDEHKALTKFKRWVMMMKSKK